MGTGPQAQGEAVVTTVTMDGSLESKASRDPFQLVGQTVLGALRVDALVAEGGFGVIYRAFHEHFRARVALKCLKVPDGLDKEERRQFLEQFRVEAQVLFELSRSIPAVVRPLQVDSLGLKDGTIVPVLVLEWLEGQTLEMLLIERARRGLGPLELQEVVELLHPLAKALDQMHRKEGVSGALRVVHRDIKPANIFVAKEGGISSVKILDFGISKVQGFASFQCDPLEGDTRAPFSPGYAAPEQWRPERYGPTGPWTDVWGLALTLCEAIKGDLVLEGTPESMMTQALDPMRRPTPSEQGVRVAGPVNLVFARALALDPQRRYESVGSFWSALTSAMRLSEMPNSEARSSLPTVRLPVMRPPTPLSSPYSAILAASERSGGGRALPRPGRALDSQQASYPMDPTSELLPVLAASASRIDPPDLAVPRVYDSFPPTENVPFESADDLVSTLRAPEFVEERPLDGTRAARCASDAVGSSAVPRNWLQGSGGNTGFELEATSAFPASSGQSQDSLPPETRASSGAPAESGERELLDLQKPRRRSAN